MTTPKKGRKMTRRNIIIAAVAAALALYGGYRLLTPKNHAQIMAVTGATPLAVKQDVKSGMSLEVYGLTKKTYRFGARALNAFAPVTLRTRELAPGGKFMGTYRYTGVPALHLLEGIAVKKPENAAYDRPLDMVVTFESADGKKAHFSYGELTMTDDAHPVMLAYDRREIVPTKKDKEKPYKWNAHSGNLTGLRLVCPAEPDTKRYLDNVVRVKLWEPGVDNTLLPVMKKGAKCRSDSVTVIRKGKKKPIAYGGVKKTAVNGWVRTGHGRGYKGISKAEGYALTSLLKKNFPGCGENDFFLFVACDGYRTIISGRELFRTPAGRGMMIIERLDGKKPAGGVTLGPVNDYFVDRDVWGLSHIMLVEGVQ